MPRISIADLEQFIELEDDFEFEDKRERVRDKEAKNRFKKIHLTKKNGVDSVQI
jgi:hypothetical protein